MKTCLLILATTGVTAFADLDTNTFSRAYQQQQAQAYQMQQNYQLQQINNTLNQMNQLPQYGTSQSTMPEIPLYDWRQQR